MEKFDKVKSADIHIEQNLITLYDENNDVVLEIKIDDKKLFEKFKKETINYYDEICIVNVKNNKTEYININKYNKIAI